MTINFHTDPATFASKVLGACCLNEAGLPPWMTFTRAAGNNSYQTKPAVNGTTFIALNAGVNVPRFNYQPLIGRRMLLVEPTRENRQPYSQFADVSPPGGNPDGWTGGGAGWACIAGGPDSGLSLRKVPANSASPSPYISGGFAVSAGQMYTTSAWIRRVAVSTETTMSLGTDGVAAMNVTLVAGTHDWRFYYKSALAAATPAYGAYFLGTGAEAYTDADLRLSCGQIELGPYASTWVPTTAAAATRAAELCPIDASKVGQTAGMVSFLFSPLYASTAFATVATLFEWAPGWRLDYDGADDKFKVIVNGTARAQSTARAFAANDVLRLSVEYSGSGQWLTVDGVTFTDATTWGTPTLAPYLGSRAASANCESAGYADFVSAVP